MYFGFGVWLVLIGVLGASSIIISKKPDARELIGKIAPYQGWIGVISVFYGIWGVISSVLTLGWLSSGAVVPWVILLVTAVLLLALGFILGFGVLKTFVKDANAQAKMDQTLHKLLPYQGNMGLLAILVGIFSIVSNVIWHH